MKSTLLRIATVLLFFHFVITEGRPFASVLVPGLLVLGLSAPALMGLRELLGGGRESRRLRRPRFPKSRRSAPICLVCRASLVRDIVLCARCSTPHHRECFDYAGVCAVFGCGGSASRPAVPEEDLEFVAYNDHTS